MLITNQIFLQTLAHRQRDNSGPDGGWTEDGRLSMCVENVLVGGRNFNKFKSGHVNDKCYTTGVYARSLDVFQIFLEWDGFY